MDGNGSHTIMESAGNNPEIIMEVRGYSANQQGRDGRIEDVSPMDVESESKCPLTPGGRESNATHGSSRGRKRTRSPKRLRRSKKDKVEQNEEELSEKRGAMMIVAVLIATVTYQAALNPPGGFWQESKSGGSADRSTVPAPSPGEDDDHIAGTAINNDLVGFQSFLIANIVGLFASLVVILLLTSAIPITRQRMMWVLMVIMWISVFSVAVSFLSGVAIIVRRQIDEPALTYIENFAIACGVVLVVLLVVHVVIGVRNVFGYLKKKRAHHEKNACVPSPTAGSACGDRHEERLSMGTEE